MAVVGISMNQACGVRDHATLLAGALEHAGMASDFHWLTREDASLPATRARVREFTRRTVADIAREQPEAIVVHYSVFAYAYKGVPVFVRPLLAALRGTGRPLIVVMHEFAYPWRYGGWRGAIWAVSQRAVLRSVVASSFALLVTAEIRVRWLRSRRWLPRRPVALAPVFSNLPAPDPSSLVARRIGVFGYSYQGAAVSLVLDALARLRGGDENVTLRLLGAPGPDSASGRDWRARAGELGVDRALSFSGRLSAQALSNELASCEVLLFIDTAGPSSRKTTLAASLASGRPVLALDGPARWPALVDSHALEVVRPDAAALADAAAAMLGDAFGLDSLGARGRAFYEREMTLERTAEVLTGLLADSRQADSAAR